MTATKLVSLRFLTGPYVGVILLSRVATSTPSGKCIRDITTGALLLIGSPTLKGGK